MKKTFNKSLLSFLLTFLFVEKSRCLVTPALREFLSLDKLNLDEDSFSDEYDFIVVGGGTAGSVVASRLTENPHWTVLMLERGVEESVLTDVPLLAPALYDTDYIPKILSDPRPRNINNRNDSYCLGLQGARCNLLSGNAVGGSSVVNYMIYARGGSADYDEWKALGNPGWSYKDVLPYFIKSENSYLPDADYRYHGRGGYLDVNYPPYDSELTDAFLKAGTELGYETLDYHGEKIIGFSKVQATLRNGHRMSASKAFLRPIRKRPNFHLSQRTTVTKIVIDPRTKTAVGVRFVKNNKKYFVRARKEVVVSAGTLKTPQILMLSGVGPKDHLKSLGIPVIEDLPVGHNLLDHICMPTLNFLVNESVTIVQQRLALDFKSPLDYLIKGTGVYTLPGGTAAVAFLSVADEDSGKGKADIELVMGLSGIPSDVAGFYKRSIGLSDDLHKTVFGKYKGLDSFTVVPILLKPKSRGRITLRSTDPFELPRYEPNYYDHADDVKTMIRGIRKAIEVTSTSAFKRYNATLVPLVFPQCQHTVYMTDSYWECVMRHISSTVGHFAGSCKMSPRDKAGVVDHRLRVYGIKSLRIVDNSIMPELIAGHTCAPAYMIGEKASDMIREDCK
ncbi:hypothetical protein KPH14_002079 [Odynerus spinipes]|uniref:Glucose-methanol-choline oxidoreductase N-terminal domain-containing protein n=1 Tax=Odynerus spinipes TaxID=1348599 RepID=A0AAD9VPQ9_9HYME|nr:hypothetical protein KPH14_002079 [Odynerus spinipes]